MIDVLKKLTEIQNKSPEDIGRAMENLNKLNPMPVKESVQITTTGNDAVLAQILKLAGMIGAESQINVDYGTTPSEFDTIPHDHALVPSDDMSMDQMPPEHDMDTGMDDELDMDMDSFANDDVVAGPTVDLDASAIKDDLNNPEDRPYTNSPHEITKGLRAAVPSGNDLARPKATFPKVAGGDNPTHVSVSFED